MAIHEIGFQTESSLVHACDRRFSVRAHAPRVPIRLRKNTMPPSHSAMAIK